MPRPPKNVRDAMKRAGEWDIQPSPPPFDPVAAFCSGGDDTLPMPGAFDAIAEFTSGPPPDSYIVNGPMFGEVPDVISEAFDHNLPGAGVFQSMSLDGDGVTERILAAAYTAAALQISVSHLMVSGNETQISDLAERVPPLPDSLMTYVRSMGESVGTDGRRWVYSDVHSEMRAAARAARHLTYGEPTDAVTANFWLPTKVDDERCRLFLASQIQDYLRERGVNLDLMELNDRVFSGNIPPALAVVAHSLPPDELLPLKEFFQTYSTDLEFLTRFSSSRGFRALSLIGLSWDNPCLQHLDFSMSLRSTVIAVSTMWDALYPVFERALGVKFSVKALSTRGSLSQFCLIIPRPGGVVIKSHNTLDPFSRGFRACFGTPVCVMTAPTRVTCVGQINPREHLIPQIYRELGV